MRRSSGPAASAISTLPAAWAPSNQRPRPTTAASAVPVCGANPYHSQRSMLALKRKPSTAVTAASANRRRTSAERGSGDDRDDRHRLHARDRREDHASRGGGGSERRDERELAGGLGA